MYTVYVFFCYYFVFFVNFSVTLFSRVHLAELSEQSVLTVFVIF